MDHLSYAQMEALMELLDKVALPQELNLTKRSTPPAERQNKKKSRSMHKKSFKLSCELFIKFAVEHTKAIPPNWSAFFYTRMQLTQSILEKDFILDRMDAFHHYYAWYKNKNADYATVALSLVEYFKHHQHDPDNALIGLQTNEELFNRLYERTADCKKYRLPRDVTPIREIVTLPEISTSTSLIHLLARKRKPKNEEKDGDYVVGEIVICCKQPIWQLYALSFARVADVPDADSVLIHCNPSETEPELIPITQVVPLHPEMAESFYDVKKMQKLVSDPLDSFFNKMTEEVKEQTNTFLREHDIDTDELQEILDRSEEDQKLLSMKDLPILMRINEKFKKWKENPPKDFYDKIDIYCTKALEDLQNNPPEGAFQPTIVKALADLASVKFSQLAKNRLNRFVGNCETALGYLNIEKNQFTNGTRKNTLTAWWLGKIDSTARKFLAERNYDDAAIPEDYISEPPKDLNPIKKNLQIIESILNPTDGNMDARNLADTLKTQIYKKINSFVADETIIIADMLGFEPEQFTVSFAESVLLSKKEIMEPSAYKCIADMIKDVDYLLEMQEMEDPAKQQAPGGGLVLSNVVPVSGLIMSTFFRRENVLRTILELYDYTPKPQTNPPTETENTSPSEEIEQDEVHHDAHSVPVLLSSNDESISLDNEADTVCEKEKTVESVCMNDDLPLPLDLTQEESCISEDPPKEELQIRDIVGISKVLKRNNYSPKRRSGSDLICSPSRDMEHIFENDTKSPRMFSASSDAEFFSPLIVYEQPQIPDNKWRLSTSFNTSTTRGQRRHSAALGGARMSKRPM